MKLYKMINYLTVPNDRKGIIYKKLCNILENRIKITIEGDYIKLMCKHDLVAVCRIRKFPANSGICIFTNSEVTEQYRGKGIGTLFNEYRCILAREHNFSVAMCTVVSDNIAQIKVLEKNGWTAVVQFNNSLITTNNNLIYVKNLIE